MVEAFETSMGFPRSEHPPKYYFKPNQSGVPSFIPKLMGDAILKVFRFFALSRKSDMWVYNDKNGVWTPNGTELICSIVTNWLGELYRPSNAAWAEDYIRHTNYIDKDLIDGQPEKIVLKNGVYDLDTDTLGAFDPEIYALQALPIIYDPEAKAEKINKFLEEICPDRVTILKEMAAYCLLRSMPLHRFFILEGTGRNGKGSYINLLSLFLGEENVSNVSLQHLDQNRFKPAELHGKLANLSNDIPSSVLKNTGIIKQLAAGDGITVEKKGRDPFQMKSYAKLIFSANEVPATRDDTDAFYRRAVTIKFMQKFDDGVNAIPNIWEKLATEEELSGFFNEAITHLKSLLKRGRFNKERTIEERKMEYIKLSNPIHYFALTHIVKDLNSIILKTDLYNAYVKVCEELGKIPTNDSWFGKNVRRYLPYTHEALMLIDRTKHRIWKGIRIKGTGDTGDTAKSLPQILDGYSIKGERENAVSAVSTVSESDQSLQNKLEEYLHLFGEKARILERDVVDRDWFHHELVEEGWDDTDPDRVLEILKRDGMIFEPRPGKLKRC